MNLPRSHRLPSPRRTSAITLIEALVVLVLIAVVALTILPAMRKAKAKSPRINCVNRLRQIGIAYRLFAMDHDGQFPFEVSPHEGGSRGLVGGAWLHFRPASNELASPRMLVCPSESKARQQSYVAANRRSPNLNLDRLRCIAGNAGR